MTPSRMKSPTPVPRTATTGTPAHRASRAAIPKDSSRAGATYRSASASRSTTPSWSSRPGRDTRSRSPRRATARATAARCGPSPAMTARQGTDPASCRSTSCSVRTRASGRLRAARRMTDTTVSRGRAPTAECCHAPGSIPLCRTWTGRSSASPSAAAATSLTALHATRSPSTRAVPRTPQDCGVRGGTRECMVSRVGIARAVAVVAADQASGDTTEVWQCTTSGAIWSMARVSPRPSAGSRTRPGSSGPAVDVRTTTSCPRSRCCPARSASWRSIPPSRGE